MGNVSVREQAKGKQFDQDECFMECGHAQAHVSDRNSSSSYPAHMLPHHRASASHTPQIVQVQRDEYKSVNQEKSMPVVIRWIHGGTEIAIEGSWDNWRTRELLECSGSDFFIVKVLNVGVYHYRFVVDGRWTYASDLPHELDDIGNVFNILDLKESYSENGGRDEEPECPSSPVSSYNNAGFTLQDFGEKLPELPPLLQQMPLNQPSSSKNFQQALHKPLPANLNHLYVKRDGSNQPVVALSSSQRFRSKFVTTVLYKPFKKVRK
ncbi:SNF1-related protein kinase regulatory subunit beta-2 isoform X1 [Helianthus annuus]|uniref:SNF1-related protein kinase regulatory subunit beta-2 isoform X1 n=1 Tax=Helianthus annuus TaxID=4232 RepID=UPI000B8FAE13|nr:SNF1-related protein kinase regulatory subunit beta-2 isoform X1 [Helianthus annuus]XP_035844327.1 SNF1-related protein kinase regulatory subunit beta-2 isoform X1 [Helianthus annuus]